MFTKKVLLLSFLLATMLVPQVYSGEIQVYPSVIGIGRGFDIREGQTVDGHVISVGGPVRVAGQVRGLVVTIGNSVIVEDEVGSSVYVVGGDAKVGPSANIDGNIVIMGGSVAVHPSASVVGDIVRRPVALLSERDLLGEILQNGIDTLVKVSRFVVAVLVAFIWFAGLGIGLLLSLVAPELIHKLERNVEFRPVKSLGAGLLALLIALIMAVLLAFSLLGLVFVGPWLVIVAVSMTFAAFTVSKVLLEKSLRIIRIYSCPDALCYLIASGLVILAVSLPYVSFVGLPLAFFASLIGLGGITYVVFGRARK